MSISGFRICFPFEVKYKHLKIKNVFPLKYWKINISALQTNYILSAKYTDSLDEVIWRRTKQNVFVKLFCLFVCLLVSLFGRRTVNYAFRGKYFYLAEIKNQLKAEMKLLYWAKENDQDFKSYLCEAQKSGVGLCFQE